MGIGREQMYNPFRSVVASFYNQVCFNLHFELTKVAYKDYPEGDFATAHVFAYMGGHITDKDVLEVFRKARESPSSKEPSLQQGLKLACIAYDGILKTPQKIPALIQRVVVENGGDILGPIRKLPLLTDKFHFTLKQMAENFNDDFYHSGTLFGSIAKSMLLMKALKSAGDRDRAEADHNLLLSHCNNVISAEVPARLREIALAIEDKEGFARMDEDEAVKAFQSMKRDVEKGNKIETLKESKAALLWSQFLAKHGHRGNKEQDPYFKPLIMDTRPAIQVIQVRA